MKIFESASFCTNILVSCVPAICPDDRLTVLPRGLHQGAEGVLSDGCPLHLKDLNQPDEGACWRVVGSDASPKNVPEVLNWVEIR